MTKRSFVWFLGLLQLMAFTLFLEPCNASCKPEPPTPIFVQEIVSDHQTWDQAEFCPEDVLDETPIVQADDCEWKESLTDLLRHRHSTYRFVFFETTPSLFIDLIPSVECLAKTLRPNSIYLNISVLPDYYSFLHRLCPF